MGRYLDMLRNDKPDQTIGRIPNENYAREIKQLFSIGLYRMWPDGTLMLNSKDYADRHLHAARDRRLRPRLHRLGLRLRRRLPHRASAPPTNWIAPDARGAGPALHRTEAHPEQRSAARPADAWAASRSIRMRRTTATHFNDPAYQALPAQELDAAHDQLFNHPNVGPFICRQLIQRLVTSHPSRDYLYRVVQKFNDNGSGVRGDMKAVIKAILLDYEARSTDVIAKPAFGKQREPVLRVAAAARAFRAGCVQRHLRADGHDAGRSRSPPRRRTSLQRGNNVFLDFTVGQPGALRSAPTRRDASPARDDLHRHSATGWSSRHLQHSGEFHDMHGHHAAATGSQAGHQVYVDFHQRRRHDFHARGWPLRRSRSTPARLTQQRRSANDPALRSPSPVAGTTAARSGNVHDPAVHPGSYSVTSVGPHDHRPDTTARVTHGHQRRPPSRTWATRSQLNFYDAGNSTTRRTIDVVDRRVGRRTRTR